MGRRRSTMKLIEDKKLRVSTFERRRRCLFKKAKELSTLCDVKVGIIMFGPDEPEIWHGINTQDVNELIDIYKNQPIHDKNKRTKDLSTFVNNHKTALSKLKQKNNVENPFPTWNNLYDDLSEQQLRELVRALDAKLDVAKVRFDILNENYGAMDNLMFTRSKLEVDEVVCHPQAQLSDQDQHTGYEMDCFDSDLIPMENLMMVNSSSDFPEFESDLPPLGGGFFYDNPMIGLDWRRTLESAGPWSQIDDYLYDPLSEFSF